MGQLSPSNNIYSLNIINITPDSFSDGGRFSSYTELKNELVRLSSEGENCFDFGAQSTAPSAVEVSSNEEIERFRLYFKPLLKISCIREIFKHSLISIDTFRPEVFEYIYRLLESSKVTPSKLIWNDISGKVDDNAFSIISKTNCDYVLCHNLAPIRADSAGHINHIYRGEKLMAHLLDFFNNSIRKIPARFQQKIIIDPCFGFSKTLAQNYEIIGNFNSFINGLHFDNRILIGLSRKSFIKKLLNAECRAPTTREMEALHFYFLMELSKYFDDRDYLIRAHEHETVQLLRGARGSLTFH